MKYQPSSLQTVIETVRAWQEECDARITVGAVQEQFAYQSFIDLISKVKRGEMPIDQCKELMRNAICACDNRFKWGMKAAYERVYELVNALKDDDDARKNKD